MGLRIAFLLLFVASAAASGAERHPTNLELIRMAVGQALDTIVEHLPSLEQRRLVLKEDGESHGGWLVEQVMASHLGDRGWEVVLAQTSASGEGGYGAALAQPGGGQAPSGPQDSSGSEQSPTPGGAAICYRVVELGVVYGNRHRQGLFGSSAVERIARAELSLLLTRLGSGEVLWAEQVRGEARDEVPEEKLKVLEAGSFTFHPKEMKEGGRSFLEPLVVAALVGTLIYLFYSTKSTD